MDRAVVLKKTKDIVSRAIDDDLILVPIYKTGKDINYIYTLNKQAAKIWDYIDGKSTLGEIRKKLKEYYNIDDKTLDKSMDEFIKDLKSIKAIE
ncbi:PqqD family protein [Omnitrophica bacterium]|nr:PqqD family protein [Candidatus Omnitrophota bacterium]